MTLDDLERSYDDAFHSAPWNTKSRKRAGIRAVVEALRDDMTLGWDDNYPWGDVSDEKKYLNKILGSSEGAAGGSARKDEQDCSPVDARPQDAQSTPVAEFCEDCPPDGYPTDKTRCKHCPRRSAPVDLCLWYDEWANP